MDGTKQAIELAREINDFLGDQNPDLGIAAGALIVLLTMIVTGEEEELPTPETALEGVFRYALNMTAATRQVQIEVLERLLKERKLH